MYLASAPLLSLTTPSSICCRRVRSTSNFSYPLLISTFKSSQIRLTNGAPSESTSRNQKDCPISAGLKFGTQKSRWRIEWEAFRLFQRFKKLFQTFDNPLLTNFFFFFVSHTGTSAIKALLSPAYSKLKGVPKITSETEAHETLSKVNSFAFFLRVQRGGPSGKSSSSPKVLQIIPEQAFAPEEYFAWFFEGSQWTTYAGGVLMVVIMLAGVMFPLWPVMLRLGVWYLSIGVLGLIGLFFALAIVRLIFYIITIVVASPGIWIFPQLFADVGFVSLFVLDRFL